MNKPLRRVALAMMAMIVLLLGNLTYIQVIQADKLHDDPRNSRTQYEEYSKPRGQIIAGGESIANSVPTDDQNLKFLRQYPKGPAFAPVTGYHSAFYGSNGIEQAKDKILNGTDDSMKFGQLSDMITGKGQQGGNVNLTIQPEVQQTAYDELTKRGFQGSVVALNPSNGKILGMANAPSYDPNALASHWKDEAQQNWQNLEKAEGSPMTNRAVSEIYPPGSSFKLITGAAALQNGYNPQSKITQDAQINLPGTTTPLPNYGNQRCKGDTLTAAMAHSCNTAFADIAGKVGADKLRQTAAAFGFDQDLQVPMTTAKSTTGPMSDAPSLYQSGIGQRDVRVTPMQNAMMASAIANDGKLMKPQMVENTQTANKSIVDEFKPQELNQAVTPDVAHSIRDMMLQSEKYTVGEGKIKNVPIASKTGTAQHGDAADKPHGWYVAFAPAEHPQIAVAVIVENGGDQGADATGGKVAAPIGRSVIRAGLQGGG